MSLICSLMDAHSQKTKKKTEACKHQVFTKRVETIQFSSIADLFYSHIDRTSKNQSRDHILPMHVSAALSFCARKTFIGKKANEVDSNASSKKLSPSLAMTFQIGKSIEGYNQQIMIDVFGKQNIFGTWKCRCGSSELKGFGADPFPRVCSLCLGSVFDNYSEAQVEARGLIRGAIDCLFRKGLDSPVEVLELKTINGKDFKDLLSPKPLHIMQAFFYYKILQENKESFLRDFGVDVDAKQFTIVYSNKDFLFSGNPWKSFVVKISDIPKPYNDLYEEVMEGLKILIEFPNDLPPRTKCTSLSSTLAKECLYAVECFQYGN